MNVKIGAKIKTLRKRDNVTQERLAEALGVTSQAISKWESENGYPDIEYISPIANFFNVTTDYLFNHDIEEKRRKIDEYCNQSQNKLPQERIDIMRQALAEFPAEEKLLFILADALHDKWKLSPKSIKIVDGCYVVDEEKNKSSGDWKESAAIFEELLVTSVDDSIRAKSRWSLAMLYGKLGEKEKVMKIAEKCDPMGKSRQMLLSNAMKGSTEYEIYLKEAILDLIDNLTFTLTNLSLLWANHTDGEDLKDEIMIRRKDIEITIYTKISKFVLNGLDFVDHTGNYHYINRKIIFLYCSYALELILLQKIDEAFEQLEIAYKYAKSCDDRLIKNSEYFIKTTPENLKIWLLPLLLDELKSEHYIGIPSDPLLCNDSRFMDLLSKIEADAGFCHA